MVNAAAPRLIFSTTSIRTPVILVASARLVEESESHVVVLLLGLLLLLLFLGGVAAGRGVTAGGGSGRGGGPNAGADVGDQLLDVAALQGLGEEAGPVGLHLDLGGLQEGVDLLTLCCRHWNNDMKKSSKSIRATYSDGDVVVGEDEGGVDAGELGLGHGDGFGVVFWPMYSQVADF